MIWKEKNKIAFENGDFSTQRLKNSFLCIVCSWSKVFIDEGSLHLINFFGLGWF